MSSTVDNRIVEMQFNNERFERNVSTSISTLDKLKAALNFDTASKNITAIEKGFDKLNLSGVGSAVDVIASRFSTLGVVATTILQDIGHMAFQAGQRILGMINSMTFGQIVSGWDKYADKTTSVQTIMSATGQTWEKDADTIVQLNELISKGFDPKNASAYLQTWKDVNSGVLNVWSAAKKLGITTAEFQERTKDFSQISGLKYVGTQMDYVNSQMEKLNWFTDETSYNFTDMVSNIGKFTANNIPLSEAVTSMQGIATWAAKSGQNATTASRVMYNLAQSIGAGSVKLMDWRSVETANMATAEFKEEAIKAAAANGKLRASVDKTGKTIYKTTSGMEVTVENFAQTLSTGWFDKNTLLATLDKYGSFTNKLYEFSEASGLTATEILQLIDAEKDGAITQKEYERIMADSGMSMEEVKEALAELGSEENEFGRKAFEASQEAKTFQEAVDSVKEAASTKWMHIFENIFGDYEKAKERWTAFAEFLYDTFITPLEKIEEISEILGEINAVDRIANGFQKLFAVFKGDGEETFGIIDAIANGVKHVFPPINNLRKLLSNAIKNFNLWAKSLQLNTTQTAHLRLAAQGVANVLKFLINTIKNVWDATEPLRTALSGLAESLAGLISRFLRTGNYMDTTGAKVDWLQKICSKLAEIIDKVSEAFDGISLHDILDAFSKLSGVLEVIKQSFINIWNATEPLRISLQGLGEAIKNLFGRLFEASGEFELTELKADGLRSVCEKLALAIDKVTEFINGISVEDIQNGFAKVAEVVQNVGQAFDWVVNTLTNFKFGSLLSGIGKVFLSVFTHIKNFLTKTNWGTVIKVALGAILAGFIYYKGYIIKWLLTPLKNLSEMVGEFADQLWTMNLERLSAVLRNVAIAIGILAVSLLVLSYVDYGKATAGLMLIAGILGVLAYAINQMKLVKVGMKTIFQLVGISASLLMIAGAILVFSLSLVVLAGVIAIFSLIAKNIGRAIGGIILLVVTLGAVVGMLELLSDIKAKVLIGVTALLLLSASLIVLAVALGAFSALAKNVERSLLGLGLMLVSLAALVYVLKAISDIGPKVLIGVAALILISAALIVLAIALGAFTLIAKNIKSAIAGFALMIVSLAALCGVLELLSDVSPKAFIGIGALMLLSATLVVLAIALGAFALIAKDIQSALIGAGLLAALLAIVIMGLEALSGIGPQVIIAAGSLLLVAVACLALAASIYVVSLALPLLGGGLQALAEGIAAGLIALGEGILSFGLSITTLLGAILATIATGVAQIISSVGEAIGTAILAISLGLAESIGAVGEGIGTALSGISEGVLAAFTALGEGIAALGAGIGEAAASIGSGAGEGIAAAGEGIGTAIEGISSGIATGLESISSGITTLGEGIASAISAIAQAVSGGLTDLGTGISGFGDGVGDLITTVLGSVATGIEEVVAAVGKGIADGVTAISTSVSDLGTSLTNLGTGITDFGAGVTSLKGIDFVTTAAGVAEMGRALNKLKINNLDTTVSEAAAGIVTACTEMSTAIQTALTDTYTLIDTGGGTIVTNMATGIYSKLSSARTAGVVVGSAVLTGIRTAVANIFTLGANAAQGFINGFISKEIEAKLAGGKLAKKAVEGAQEELDSHSPSRVFFKLGNFAGQGFINGLSVMEDSVEDAGRSLSKSAVSSVIDSMAAISDLMDQNPEFNPTIRPVLDSSSVESGLSRLGVLGTASYMDAQLNANQDLTQIQNGSQLLANALSNANSLREHEELSQLTAKDFEQFISIGNQIVSYIKDGHDIFFDDGTFAGRINRRLGSV